MEEKAFNKPRISAYLEFSRLLNNELIEEHFKDKEYYHVITKEKYRILRFGESMDNFNPIILVKNLTTDKIQGLKFSDLRNLEEIIITKEDKTTSE